MMEADHILIATLDRGAIRAFAEAIKPLQFDERGGAN